MKFNSENKMFKRKGGSEDNNPKIIEWLTTELDRGEDPKRLRKALRQQNVDPMLVDKAIKSKKENSKGRKPLYFYTAFILIIICAGVFLAFTLIKPDESPTTTTTPITISTTTIESIASTVLEITTSIPTKIVCGNKACESGESCYNCPQDCKCAEGEYCSAEEKKCVKTTCGDGKCEPYENPYNCCLDCKCPLSGEICNKKTKKCGMAKVNISDEKLREMVIDYYGNQGKSVNSLEIKEVMVWENKTGRKVEVNLQGQEKLSFVLVTKDKEVIELPFW